MNENEESKTGKLARLQGELEKVKATLPEHCHGAEGYIGAHRASLEHLEKLEDTEEEIKKLKAELETTETGDTPGT